MARPSAVRVEYCMTESIEWLSPTPTNCHNNHLNWHRNSPLLALRLRLIRAIIRGPYRSRLVDGAVENGASMRAAARAVKKSMIMSILNAVWTGRRWDSQDLNRILHTNCMVFSRESWQQPTGASELVQRPQRGWELGVESTRRWVGTILLSTLTDDARTITVHVN